MSSFSQVSAGDAGLVALGSDGAAYVFTTPRGDYRANPSGTWTPLSNAGVTAPLTSVSSGSLGIVATDTAGLVFFWNGTAWTSLPAHP